MTDKAYRVILVPPERAREFWPVAKKHLKAAIDLTKGRWKAEYILAALVLNEQQLWVVHDNKNGIDGAVITQKRFYPEKTTLMVHFLGGVKFDIWFECLASTLTSYARKAECESIECLARTGFWKWFKEEGFSKSASYYEKEL